MILRQQVMLSGLDGMGGKRCKYSLRAKGRDPSALSDKTQQ